MRWPSARHTCSSKKTSVTASLSSPVSTTKHAQAWPIAPAAPVTAVDTLQLRLQETQQKSYVICSRLDNEMK